jgi:hypothetical protein
MLRYPEALWVSARCSFERGLDVSKSSDVKDEDKRLHSGVLHSFLCRLDCRRKHCDVTLKIEVSEHAKEA